MVKKAVNKKTLKWFKPKVHSGWKKTLTPRGRRIKSLKSHKGNFLSTARSLGALANVNSGKKGDRQTYIKAKADSVYFYKKHKETGR